MARSRALRVSFIMAEAPPTLATSQIKTKYFASWFNERGGPSVFVPRQCEIVISRLEQLQPFEVDLRPDAARMHTTYISLVVNIEVTR